MTAAPSQTLPASIEAEQALLGALMMNNRVFDYVGGIVKTEHFFEPLHGRIYQVIVDQIASGRTASPLSIIPALGTFDVAPGVSIKSYVVRLLGETPSVIGAPDAAEIVRDQWALREIMAATGDATLAEGGYPRDRLAKAFEAFDEVRATLASVERRLLPASRVAVEIMDRIARVRRGETVDVFTTTGFPDLDRMLNGGMSGGDLITMGARTGVGKTVMADALAVEVARRGTGVLLFSLEVDRLQTVSRMLSHLAYSSHSTLTFGRIKSGHQITDDEIARLESAQGRLDQSPVVIDDSSNLTVTQIAQRCRAEKEKMAAKGVTLGVVVVDYLKFVKASDRYKGQRVYEVGEISAGLKQLAKDLNVAVVLCAQLNRMVESRNDKRPDLSDLRESGDLEADADVVMLLYREHYYLSRSPEFARGEQEVVSRAIECEHDLDVIIAKNRRGPTGTTRLFCDVSCSHVSSRQISGYGGPR